MIYNDEQQRINQNYTMHSNKDNKDTEKTMKKEENKIISQFGSVKWTQKQEGDHINKFSIDNKGANQNKHLISV